MGKVVQLELFTISEVTLIYKGREAVATICWYGDGTSEVLQIRFI